jgi:ADP-ribose pyrophosphatase
MTLMLYFRIVLVWLALSFFAKEAFASEVSRQAYLELVSRFPTLVSPLGDATKGEIEVLLDPQVMASIEKTTGRDVGILMQDRYWLWINDACKFPNGTLGVYGRILWTNGLVASPGVAIMPILPNGKVVLNCNFRHATRSWEIELVRGLVGRGESAEEAAKREALEETGMVLTDIALLGTIPPDTGITSTLVPLFVGHVMSSEAPRPEDTEAIEEIFALSIETIKQAFLDGYYECKIRNETLKVPFRDPFLSYALLVYELKSQNH